VLRGGARGYERQEQSECKSGMISRVDQREPRQKNFELAVKTAMENSGQRKKAQASAHPGASMMTKSPRESNGNPLSSAGFRRSEQHNTSAHIMCRDWVSDRRQSATRGCVHREEARGKLRYMHRNPVRRGLVLRPGSGCGAAFAITPMANAAQFWSKSGLVSALSPDPRRHRGPPVKPPRVGHPVSCQSTAGPAPPNANDASGA
jgi:hypothetical protein